MIRYLQKSAGYALTGEVWEKLFQFVHGRTETGKSQFVDALMGVLGDYAAAVSADAFMRSRTDKVPADLAQLTGVRLVTATEPEQGKKWDEQKLKAITGGDAMQVRLFYGQFFTYKPQFKVLVVGNHEPEIRTVDDAMLRRIHIIPLDRKVPREMQIPKLGERMVREEGPAILAWMIEGCLAWQREGLEAPDAVRARTDEYANEEDMMQQWLNESCLLGPEHEVSVGALYASWEEWCHRRNERPGKYTSFGRSLKAFKHRYRWENKQQGTTRRAGYVGVAVRNNAAEDFDA